MGSRQQPRAPDGRWDCAPSYPRLRSSPCGCGGGGLHPCPVAQKLAPVRAKARKSYVRRQLAPQEIEELESELYGVESEREALAEALDSVRSRIQAAGSRYHRARDQGKYGNVSRGKGHSAIDQYGEDSERGYEDLLTERKQLKAHEEHLRREARSINLALRAARSGRRLAGAARSKDWLKGWPRTKMHPTVIVYGEKHKPGPEITDTYLPYYRRHLEDAGFRTSLRDGVLYAYAAYADTPVDRVEFEGGPAGGQILAGGPWRRKSPGRTATRAERRQGRR